MLKDLWVGSQATTANSCSTTEDEEEYSFNENKNNNENNEDNENLDGGKSEESLVEKDGKLTGSSKQWHILLKKMLLESLLMIKENKNLSASQCHQVYLYLSKEELHLK